MAWRPRRIAVVGAGPAGALFAWLAASRGYSVDLYDMHETYKSPCGEAIPGPAAARWDTRSPVDHFVLGIVRSTAVREIRGFEMHLPGKAVKYVFNKLMGWIVDKAEMVERLRKAAIQAGASFHVERVDPRRLARDYDVVVDARGPLVNEPVRRIAVLRGYAMGAASLDRNVIHMWMDRRILGYFWAFPRKGDWNIGIGCLGCSSETLRSLYREYLDKARMTERVEPQGWSIVAEPVRRIAYAEDGTLFLRIGEAAGHVMYHSGEGIRPAFQSAKTLFHIFNEVSKLKNMDRPDIVAKAIDKRVKKSRIHREVTGSLLLLRIMSELHKRNLLVNVLQTMPKRIWLQLFRGLLVPRLLV